MFPYGCVLVPILVLFWIVFLKLTKRKFVGAEVASETNNDNDRILLGYNRHHNNVLCCTDDMHNDQQQSNQQQDKE